MIYTFFFLENPYMGYCGRTQCIFAFQLQQWLRERATLLRYTYIACLVIYHFDGIL